jgi:ADP-ribose pyrophosphatase YjhB (NUDIX family)
VTGDQPPGPTDCVPEPPRIGTDIWAGARVAGTPRVVAVGVARRGDEVLLEAFRDGPATTLLRPPGGGVRFGERAADALRREILEELGEVVRTGSLLTVVEDVFEHEGRSGHEIVFVFAMEFEDPSVYGRDVVVARDHGDIDVPLRWHPIAGLADDGPGPLCPPGLAAVLADRGSG